MKNDQHRFWTSLLVILSSWTLVHSFLHLDYADPNEFPYVVSIYNHTYVTEQTQVPQQYLQFLCVGVLVSVRHVLTAAHCFPDSKKVGYNLVVIASVVFKGGPDRSYKVRKLSIHEKYESSKINDLALLELVDKVSNYTELYMIQEVTLPKQPFRDGLVYEIGWFPREQKGLNPHLRKVRYTIIDTIKCGEQVKDPLATAGICIEEVGKSRCFGDAGAPLIKKGAKTSQDIVIGIGTLGALTCHIGIQTHVAVYKYVAWIRSKMDLKRGSKRLLDSKSE